MSRDHDKLPEALRPFSSALAIHDALPARFKPADETPLREILAGIWPTVADLRALIEWAALKGENAGWQPIETAPKDWTNIILFDAERDPEVFEGYFSMEDGGRNCWMENQGMGSEPVNPSLWMPLPAAPNAGGRADG